MSKPSLRKVQQSFSAALFGDRNQISGLLETGTSRFDIYRNSIRETYRQTLSAIFPVTARLVGEKFFSQAATRYCREQGSTSGDLNLYGKTFPDFINEYEPARDLVYLADVARLEWLWHEAFHEADSAPLDLAELAKVDAADYGRISFDLQAGFRSLRSQYPIARIWEVNQPQHCGPEEIQLAIKPRWLLIYRYDFEVRIASVSCGVYAMTSALARAIPFAEATHLAIEAESDLQLQPTIQWLVDERVIKGYSLNSSTQAQ